MTTIVYSLPSWYLAKHSHLERELRNKKKTIIEQLPKRVRQNFTRHLALGHLFLEPIKELGLTIVSNKPNNALLSAVGLEPRYPTVAELLDADETHTDVEIEAYQG